MTLKGKGGGSSTRDSGSGRYSFRLEQEKGIKKSTELTVLFFQIRIHKILSNLKRDLYIIYKKMLP